MKTYSLIVQNDYCLSNETDSNIQTDYFPGIWGIKTQKSALKFAKEILAEGDIIKVSCYDNPKYYAIANEFIKALGLNQKLFPEVARPVQGTVTNGKPSNLAQLKKYLTVGKVIHTKNYYGQEVKEKDTTVLGVQTNSFIFEKTLGSGIKSWFEIGKANDWIFTNESAQKYEFVNGSLRLVYEIKYEL